MPNTSTQLTRHLEIEALQQAVRWPNVAPRSVQVLASYLLSARSYQQGYDYFSERMEAEPDRALYQTLAGVFQARLGKDLDAALSKLDAATERELGLPHYFRGVTLANLPDCAGRAETVVADMEFVLAVKDRFPPGLLRAVYRALATAYQSLGREEEAASALKKSGRTDFPLLITDFWVNAEDGFHLVPPRLVELATNVHVAQGYDFSDIAFVVTGESVVAIDSGSNERNARAARDALRAVTDLPISHVILTHAHWDHVGGLGAIMEAGTQVIAQVGFPEELRIQYSSPPPAPYLQARGESYRQDATPDRLVKESETLTIGGTDFVLHPISGGETQDGLLIHLPQHDVVFVGDMIMPQLGIAVFPEGSAEGLFEAMELVLSLNPSLLIHGHASLTQAFPIEAYPGLLVALRELNDLVKTELGDSRTLVEILHRNHLPEVLRDNPEAVVPYLVLRDNVIQRVYDQNTGYWRPGGEDIELFAPTEWAGALDILAGGSGTAFVRTGTDLLNRGDLALGLRLVDYGRLAHPDNHELDDLRKQIIHRLLERYQMLNPFKFVHYAGLAELDLPPVE